MENIISYVSPAREVYWCGYGNGEHGQGWTADLVLDMVREWTGLLAEAKVIGPAA